jgi:cation-transporting ATPase 13A3/4/5
MATGDNTLTAISVARQCRILEMNQEVFFGDVVNNKLVWKSQAGEDDEPSIIGLNTTRPYVEVEDDTKTVPWDKIPGSVGVALDGKTLSFIHNNLDRYDKVIYKILLKAQVYARMSPDDKANLVELL